MLSAISGRRKSTADVDATRRRPSLIASLVLGYTDDDEYDPEEENADGAPPPAEGSDVKVASQQLLAAIRKAETNNDSAAFEVVVGQWAASHCPGGVAPPWWTNLLAEMAGDINILQQVAKKGEATDMLGVLLTTYTDFVTDIMASLSLYWNGRFALSYASFGLLGFAVLCQSLAALAIGQGIVAAMVALVGGKPIYDTYNDIMEKPRTDGQLVSHSFVLVVTHCFELVFESIPQALFQTTIAVQSAEVDALQFLSIAASVLATGVIGAITDRDWDTNRSGRQYNPEYHGYFPSEPWAQSATLLGVALFLGGYNAAKMASLAVLVSAAPGVAAAWLCVECAAFLGLRVIRKGGWRNPGAGTDGFGISMLTHLGFYGAILASPMPLIRHPSFISPCVYAIGVAYSIAINPVMVAVAYQIDRSSGGRDAIAVTEPIMYRLLLASTVASFLGAALAWWTMSPSHRPTFYRHESIRQSIEWAWENRTTAPVGSGLDAARAHLLIQASTRVWPPAEKTDAWLSQWESWEDNPPVWFTPYWRRKALRQFPGRLPGMARERLERERNESRRQRRQRQSRITAGVGSRSNSKISVVAVAPLQQQPSSAPTPALTPPAR
jgi:hypothetical protein